MNLSDIFGVTKKRIGAILLSGAFLAASAFIVLVITQKNFRANTDLLIAQNQENVSNYYALSQSANYLTSVLNQSIYSEKFLNDIDATGKISSPYLFGDSTQKLKQWKKTIKIKNNAGVGIMNINVFANTSQQATEISQAVLDVLTKSNSFFLGQGQNVEIRVLSGPLVEKNPSFSEIIATSIGGFAAGVLLALLWAMYQEGYKKERSKIFTTKGTLAQTPVISFQEKKKRNDPDYLSDNSDYWKERLEASL